MNFQESMLELGTGERIAVREYHNNGPDVVLMHGAGLNLAMWDAVAERLTDDFHLVAFDFRGHGLSTSNSAFSFADDVASLGALIAAYRLHHPAVVGHSYGGRVALEYARTHAQCPLVVNVDGRGGQGRPDHYLTKTSVEVEAYWAPFEEAMLASLPTVDTGPRTWVDREIAEHRKDALGVGFPVEHGESMTERQYVPAEEGWRRTPSTDFLRGLLLQVWHQDIFVSYRLAQCPVAVVLATKDAGELNGEPSFRSDYLEALARAFPTLGSLLPTRRAFCVDASHMVPIEDPDGLASILRGILPRTASADVLDVTDQ